MRRVRLLMVCLTVLAAVGLPAGAAHAADARPSQPGGLVASDVTERGLVLTWSPAIDDTGVTGYEVWQFRGGVVTRIGRPTSTQFRVYGLRPGTTYRFFVTAVDTAGQRSAASRPVELTTPPGDTTPPTPPGQPVASEITATSVRLTWALSTDANNVDSYYVTQRGPDGVPTLVATTPALPRPVNSVVITGLAPATTYQFDVRALDVLANHSALSPVATVTTAVN